ncbi:MAG: hypothetical protein WC449_00135 [Candidatus Paceibacterota bacterium]
MNKIHKALIAGAITTFALGNFAAAQSTSTATTTPPTGKAKSFCAKIIEQDIKIQNGLQEKNDRALQNQNENQKKLDQRRSYNDTKLADKRKNWDKNSDSKFEKLLGKADTQAKKDAIAAYQKAVAEAVTARRAAIDTANEAYRKAVNTALTARKNKISTLLEAYKKAIGDAITKAKADCQAGKDSKTVRTAFLAATKAAHQKFSADKKAVEKIGSNLEDARDTHNEAIHKAQIAFSTAIEKARETLKNTFGNKKINTKLDD